MDPFKYLSVGDYAKIADEQPQIGADVVNPDVAARANEIAKTYPWIQPKTVFTLAKYNASPQAVDAVGNAYVDRELQSFDQKKAAVGQLAPPIRVAFDAVGWVAKTARAAFDFLIPGAASAIEPIARPLDVSSEYVFDKAVKPAIRWSVAAFDIIPETAQSLASNVIGGTDFDLFGLWESTSLATMLDNPEKVGKGFFMSQVLREEQAKRARAYRGTVYGNAFTVGRSIMQFVPQNSKLYKYGSGVIDAAIMIALPDPTMDIAKLISKGAGASGDALRAIQAGVDLNVAFKAGRETAPMLSEIDAKVVKKILSEQHAATRAEAGLVDGINGENVDAEKFISFFQTNPLGVMLVDKLVATTNRMEILEDIFRFEIDTNVADQLASAGSRDEVIAALTSPFTMGNEQMLTGKIGSYRVRKARSAILKTRWFTQMPKNSIVVSGDKMDDLEAIRNMTLSMRTAGVSEDVIKTWGDKAVQTFSRRGTQPARYETFSEYNDAVRHILEANGINKTIIDETLNRTSDSLDKIRGYLTDFMGIDTDNGHLRMMVELLKEHGDDAVYAEFLQRAEPILSDASFAGPAKLVHMLNRTRTLPDARELKRLTRNPLFQAAFDAAGVNMKKLPLAGKRKIVDIVKYTDEAAANELKSELFELKQLRGAALTDSKKLEIKEIQKQLDEMRYVEKTKVVSGDARLAIDLADYLQNRIWKPLNLATIGYIMRNGIDAQIRMAFGGVRSLANTTALHPLEYIHIAVGLPGKGTKYARSITGVDMTNLGVAKKLATGETILEETRKAGQYVYVGETQFETTREGMKRARAYAKKTGKPIFGVEEDAELMDDVTAASVVNEQLAQVLGEVSSRIGYTSSDEAVHMVRTGSFPAFSRKGEGDYETYMHTKGVVEQLQMVRKNETTRRVAQGIQQGKSDQQIAEEVADWLLANKNSPAYQTLKRRHLQGIEYKSEKHPGVDISAPLDFDELFAIGREEAVRQALINYTLAVDITNMRMLTGKLPEIEFMAAYNGLPDFDNVTAVPLANLERLGAGRQQMPPAVGSRARLGGQTGVVVKIEQVSEDAEAVATFVPFREYGVLDGKAPGRTSEGARRTIENSPVSPDGQMPGLPVKVPSEQRLRERAPSNDQKLLASGVDKLTGFLFNVLNDTAVKRLERSVTFRQYYYREIGQHVDRLSHAEGIRLYEDVLAKATEEGKTIRQYLGEGVRQKNSVAAKIERLNTRSVAEARGTLAVKELDDYARFKALSDTKELLYDASRRNNLTDALRIVMPFADAWKDIISTYALLGAQHNIHMIRQFARVYKGLEQADPDQDGRGFIFRDPTTNDVNFQFPLSGSLAKLFTGVDAPMSAPLSRLSQGIAVYPALGPYAQLAVSTFLPDIPKYDQIKELLLPYGETKVGDVALGVIPGSIRKTFEAVWANPDNRASTYGNVYIETLRALSVNPQYDLSTQEGIDSLMADAKSRARVLTMMRAVSQFLGPAAGVQEWKVPTSVGDKYVDVLLQELRKMQSEDYDTAIDRFLQLYGDEMMLYVSSKSRVVRDGIEATEIFGKWERDNQDIMKKYSLTGPYFGPMGADYNFTVWDRQLEEGSRERLSDVELIRLAQLRVGSTRYRSFRKLFPDDPSEKQRAILAAYRQQLHEEMPGFPSRPQFEVGKLENQLAELREAVDDSALADNPVIEPLREYLKKLDQFQAAFGGMSLQSKRKAPFRARLFALGEQLANQNPDFDRLWTRVLSAQVE